MCLFDYIFLMISEICPNSLILQRCYKRIILWNTHLIKKPLRDGSGEKPVLHVPFHRLLYLQK